MLSFASRLAAANGRTMHGFLVDMRLMSGLLARGDEAELCRLARLGRTEADRLLSSALVKNGVDFHFGGEKVQRAFVTLSKPRVCPACLVADIENGDGPPRTRPWGRVAWSISLVRTCPLHSAQLVSIDAARRGYVYQDIVSAVEGCGGELGCLAHDADPVTPSGLETYVHERLGGMRPGGFLSTLPFYVAVRLTEMVGGMILFGKNFHPNKLSSQDWLDAGREGYLVTSEGEEGIRDFLGQSFGNYLRSRRSVGGKVLFGSLHAWLLQSHKNPDYDPVRKLVREHVIDTLPVGPGDDILGTVTRRRWHSLHSAAIEYGVHPKRLRKLLIEAGHIAPSDAKLSDARVLIDAEKVAAFLQSIATSMTGEEARRYVKATRIQWEIITREGFVQPMVPSTGTNQAAYSRDALDEFLTSVVYSTGAKGRHLRHPSGAARSARCGLADVLRLLVDRKLKEVALYGRRSGFEGLRVNPAEVKRRVPRKPLPGLSMRQAAVRMGLAGNLMARLVAARLLPSSPIDGVSGNRPMRVITPEDADAFSARYITLSQAATSMGLGNCGRIARQVIEAGGIRPAFDPEVCGCRIYERAALPLVEMP